MEGDVHKLYIAQSILKTALSEAEKHNAKRICTLVVKRGRASHIEPDSLELCLRVGRKGNHCRKRWDWACEILGMRQVQNVEKYTRRHFEPANLTL